jgi:dipeptidyl aminopeptidase/acylaminoacyl peptidase
LTFLVQDDRTKWVARTTLATGALERLTRGACVVDEFAGHGRDGFAFLQSSSTEPAKVMALDQGRTRLLADHNPWLATVAVAEVRDFSSRSKDGTDVHGLLTLPHGAMAGTRQPTILWLHGGPNMQDEHAFRFERLFLAAQGYLVLSVNYRGSSGRGSTYQRAIFGAWGQKEVQDALGAVEEAVRMGLADPDRLGVGGWSYGGILTNYLIASDTRFKAAVSGASSSLQAAMYGTDEYILQYELEVGPPWKAKEQWLRLSYPFFQADRIRTPTLFLGGAQDFNVPLAGVEQMYQALRSLGVPTKLVVYPGQHHELGPLSYRKDRLGRYLAWYRQWLVPTP